MQGSGFCVLGLECRVQGFGSRVRDMGTALRVSSGFGDWRFKV